MEEMASRAAKRIKNAGIARAWGAWSEQSKTRRRQLRLIAQAGAKLTKPHVVATFGRWRASLAEQKRKFAARGVDALLEEERQVAEALAEELKRERAAGEKRLAAAAEAQKKALEAQRIALSGSAEEQAALRAEQEKEKRVEELYKKSAKRMGNQGILRGWRTCRRPTT